MWDSAQADYFSPGAYDICPPTSQSLFCGSVNTSIIVIWKDESEKQNESLCLPQPNPPSLRSCFQAMESSRKSRNLGWRIIASLMEVLVRAFE